MKMPNAPDGWPRLVSQFLENLLTDLIDKVGAQGARTLDAGRISLVVSSKPLLSELICDGTIYPQADFPILFRAISTDFNTGGEASDEFRVPNITSPLAGVEYRISVGA